MADRTCPVCNAPVLRGNQRFCEKCGGRLDSSEPTKATTGGPETQATDPPKKPPPQPTAHESAADKPTADKPADPDAPISIRRPFEPLAETDPTDVGRYQLLVRLGAGGFGTVYLGQDEDGGLAAIKIVHPGLAADPTFRGRFRREVELGMRVRSQFTTRLLAADVDAPQPWMATEFIDGPSLSEAVAKKPLDQNAVLAIAAGTIQALIDIHAAGVIHRDLKPSNILLTEAGPKIVDFGIARAGDQTAVTATGAVLGSPAFLSPEHVTRGESTEASDVFSWASSVCFAVSGRSPFGEGAPAALLYRVVQQDPEIPALDAPLGDVIAASLAKDPGDRPTPAHIATTLGIPSGTDAAARRVVQQNWQLPGGFFDPVRPIGVKRRKPGAKPLGKGQLIKAGIAVAVAAAIIAGVLLSGGSDDAPMGTASPTTGPTAPIATPATTVPPTTTVGPTTTKPPATTVRSTTTGLVVVPDVLGDQVTNATRYLQAMGLKVVTVDQENLFEPNGKVIDQSLDPGIEVAAGTRIILFVSTGTKAASSTQAPTTQAPTTQAPTTQAPTTQAPTTQAPTTQAPTTQAPTTQAPTTQAPTTQAPTTTVSYTHPSVLSRPTASSPYLSDGSYVVRVSWNPPAQSGSSGVNKYEATNGNLTWEASGDSMALVTGPLPTGSQGFKVRAVNYENRASYWSPESEYVWVPAVTTTTTIPAPPESFTPAEIAANFGDAVWRVEADGCGLMSSGSSFAIGSRHLVTNHHVISNDSTPTVVSRNGRVLQGTVIGATSEPDIAIIEVTENLGTSLEWADTDSLAEGDAILALGYPTPHIEFTVTPGMIMSFVKDGDLRIAIRTDADVDSGNSGGPALTALGEVAGVATLIEEGNWRNATLLYTADHLETTINGFLNSRPGFHASCEATPSAVGAPENVAAGTPTVSTQGNYKVNVTWDPPAGASVSQIDHYVVGGLIWDWNAEEFLDTGAVEAVTTGTQTSIELDGLLAGNEYDIFVFASDQAGELSEPGVCLTCVNTPAATSNLPTGGTISSGQSINAYLPPYQSGQWTFYGVVGGQVQIDMVSSEVDTMLALADPTGSEIATDDDSGSGLNARISTGLCSTGTYTITASRYGSTSTGANYTISLSGGTINAGACQVPSAPQNLTASSSGSYSPTISLSWFAPSVGSTACASYSCPTYRIEQSTNGSTWTLISASTSSRSKSIYSGINWGTTYYFRVAATNDNGTGSWAQTSVMASTTPGTPSGVTACRVGESDQYQISWSAPTSDGGSPVTGYTISGGSSSPTTATSPPATITASSSDYIRVYANNANGQSSSSGSITLYSYNVDTCPGTGTIPSAAQNLSAQASGSNSPTISLSWSAPSVGSNSCVYSWCPSYRIERSTNNTTWTLVQASTTLRSRTFSSGFNWGSTYYFRVAAINDHGTGPWAQTSITTSTTPGSPRLVEVCQVGESDEYQITWIAPTTDGFSPITNYTITWGTSSNHQATVNSLSHSITTTWALTVRVYANNANGQSVLSGSVSISMVAGWAATCEGTTPTTTTTTTTQPPATTTTTQPPPPTLAAPSLTVDPGYVVFAVPAKPSGFDNPGEGGPILGIGIFETAAAPPDTCSGCAVYVPCVGCVNGGSWPYDVAPWGGSVDVQLVHLASETTYFARWVIRDGSGNDAWSPATTFTTPAATTTTTTQPPATTTTTTQPPATTTTTTTQPPSATVTEVDADGGSHSSILVDNAGNFHISYYATQWDGHLKLQRCMNALCTVHAYGGSIVTHPNGYTGQWPSMARGNGDSAVFAYLKSNPGELRVWYCSQLSSCRTGTETIIGSADTESGTSMVIGANGNPVISYRNDGNLMVAMCETADCSTSTVYVGDDGSGSDVGAFSSMTLRANDAPVISYIDSTNGRVMIRACTNPNCENMPTDGGTAEWAAGSGVPHHASSTSIVMGPSSGVFISYFKNESGSGTEITSGSLVIEKCSSYTGSVCWQVARDPNGITGMGNAMALLPDGSPVVAYFDQTNTELKLARCSNANCDSVTYTVLDSNGHVGGFQSSIAVAPDGRIGVAYFDQTNQALKIAVVPAS